MMHLHWSTCVLLAALLDMEIVILICFAAFVTVNTSVVKTLYVDSLKTIYDARQYCESHFYHGTLAGWEDIVDTNINDVWDGNAYQLSSLIFIKDCTNDIGISQHTIPANIHWSEAAAQCQALCNTNTFAIKGTSCHCLSELYEPTNALDCIPMLRQPPVPNDTNSDAKTVFQTGNLGTRFTTTRCLAVSSSWACRQMMYRNCEDRLPMECKAGTSITASWQEAGFACANANSFPKPYILGCTNGPAAWVGGFRSLQYATDPNILDLICRAFSYWDIDNTPILYEVRCTDHYPFYCRYIESGYNETCDITQTASCDPDFVCTDREGTPTCLCDENEYRDVNSTICKLKSQYNETCDITQPASCDLDLVCSDREGPTTCLCGENEYWDLNNTICKKKSGYNATCDVTQPASCDFDLFCSDLEGTPTCLCYENEYWVVNKTICMTRVKYNENCSVDVPEMCADRMSCQSVAEEYRCRCEENMYLDTADKCEPEKEFNQSCIPGLNDSCRGNLICAADVAVCTCPENEYFDGTHSCFEINQYNATCPPGYDESCIGDLSCQQITESDSRCLCDQGTLYLGTTCHNGSYAVAKIFNTPMTFYEASETCSSTSAYLADDINFESIFTDCFNDTVLFHAGIKQPNTSENQCTTVQLVNGSVGRDTCLTCSMTLPFVCIEKVSDCSDKICRISDSLDTSHIKGEKGHSDPILGIVLAALGAVCVAVALLVSALCIKRRKRTKPKNVPAKENTTFVNPYDSVKSCQLNGNHMTEEKKAGTDGKFAVLGQKPEDETYSHARQHQQEGEYDTFAKPENDVTGIYDHMHNIKHLEEAEYADIGSHRVPEMSEDHSYSHMKHSKDAAEYDTFTSINKDTHNVLMESPYDALT